MDKHIFFMEILLISIKYIFHLNYSYSYKHVNKHIYNFFLTDKNIELHIYHKVLKRIPHYTHP